MVKVYNQWGGFHAYITLTHHSFISKETHMCMYDSYFYRDACLNRLKVNRLICFSLECYVLPDHFIEFHFNSQSILC